MLDHWWPIAVVTALYCVMIVAYVRAGRPAMAIVFAGYALANIGLIIDFARHG